MKHFNKARHFGHAAAFRARGITLIELMIVVAIISILAAIAYPSYQRYVARTHRNAAAACMSQIAQAMERRYTTTLSYVGDTDGLLGCGDENDLNRFYTIDFVEDSVTASTFTIQAAPTQAQIDHDVGCGTLSLDNTGKRHSDNNDICW
jgi:type IV pilus assembly protein PilE